MMETLIEYLIGAYVERMGQWFWAAIVMLPPAGLIAKQHSIGPAVMLMTVGSFVFKVLLPGGPIDFLFWLTISALGTWVALKIYYSGGDRR